MYKRLLFLILCTACTLGAVAQVIWDDAEGNRLPWAESFGDGVYNGRVANPMGQDPLGINPSDSVNSYTKSDMQPYSLLIAVLSDSLDLSVNNQFTVQVNSPVATQFIFKLEGAGESIEATRNIAVTNAWIEYTFDFSAAASFTTITKFILFFDPGVMNSGDTYLFDNIVAHPAGACAGVPPDPLILDDYECQRNVTYGVPGFTDVTVVPNPDPSGVNTSSTVAQYCDTCGTEWLALVLDWNSADVFPVTVAGQSVVNIKVWTNKAGILKFKLEGGASPPIEKDAMITSSDLNQWVDYSMDFTDQVGASHSRLVFFFNAGVLPDPTDIYYIDDIRLSAPPSGSVLEDFEGGPHLDWMPLGDPGVFGIFNGALANPDPTDPNVSSTVGSYTKGTSQFGGLQATLPAGFSLTDFPQMNAQVWAPAGATTLTMKLFSPTQGLKDVTADIPETGSWQDLNFSFDDYSSITDFEHLEIVFDQNLQTQDTWYFDNISQGMGTVDPCAGTVPIPTIIDDYSCQRNYAITAGADRLNVVANPVPGGANPDPLDKVGEYTDPLDQWSAIVYDFGGSLDLSSYNQLRVKIWAPAVVPLLFKLQGGTGAPKEIPMDVTTANTWVTYTIDFSGEAGVDHTQLALFFNAGQLPAQEDIYYLDDVEWRLQPLTECVMDFETPQTTYTDWHYFANGSGDTTIFEVSANPDQTGINPSDNVGTFLEFPDGNTFAGMYTDLPAPIALPADNKTIKMKVWADHMASMGLKLEGGIDGAPSSGDNNVMYTTPNQWAELTWDYTSLVPDNALYGRLTLILGFDNVPTKTKTYYFDDIQIADAQCGTTSLFNVSVKDLKLYPNPASEVLVVDQTEDLRTFRILNIMGQVQSTYATTGQSSVELNIDNLASGVYILAAYTEHGALSATGRFVKQ